MRAAALFVQAVGTLTIGQAQLAALVALTMLNVMTDEQKALVHRQLQAA